MEKRNITCEIIQALINSSEIPTFFLKKDGTIINCNKKALPYLKLTSVKDAENKKLSDFVDPVFYEELRKIMLECIFRGQYVKLQYHCLENDKNYDVLCSPIKDENKPPDNSVDFLFLHIMDMSHMQKIANELENAKIKAEESDILKTTFLSTISHELKTPMNSIIGFSDLLLDPNYNKANKDRFIRAINTNAKHLEELLNNILDYAKIEAGGLDLLYENFQISDLFEELHDMLIDINYQKNMDSVKIVFEKNCNRKIVSDYFRLKQILHNLISNAIKFTDSGHIKIGCNVSNKIITFYVEDTGIGINEHKLDIIFDRFVQVDDSPTKKYKGTGLGLSIAKSLVEIMGGNIWVSSKPGEGSTFFFSTPYEELDAVPSSRPAIESISYKDKTVMIVDNVPDNYSLLSLILKSKGIKIIGVEEETEILKKFKKDKQIIDAIFVDIDLPDLNINKITEKIKQINKNVTITSISKLDISNIQNVDYHIEKPFTRDKVINILNQIFNK